MERKEYLERCQQYAAHKNQFVSYQGMKYAPIAYQLAYCSDGKIRHTAVIQDANGKTLVYCRLEDVK